MNKRKGQSVFPELIRKLILATINIDSSVIFPSGDSVSTHGYDGIVDGVCLENTYVPKGASLWELGTNESPIAKIKSDYLKRKDEEFELDKCNYSYIALTSKILDTTKKKSLIEELNKETPFKEVRVYDANDIAQWLEGNISICIWLSKQCGQSMNEYAIQNVEDFWDAFSSSAEPAITLDNIIVGNEGASQDLIKNKLTDNKAFCYCVSSPLIGFKHALLFVVASIIKTQDEKLISRAMVVNDQVSLDFISDKCTDKIVLINFSNPEFCTRLKNVYFSFSTTHIYSDIKLIRPSFRDFAKTLKLQYGEDAEYISNKCGGNVLALWRLKNKYPNNKIPKWAKYADKNKLVPLMMLDDAQMTGKAYENIVEAMVGDGYDDFIDQMNTWTEFEEPPVVRYKDIYSCNTRDELYQFVKIERFSKRQKRFEEFLKKALLEENPKYKDPKKIYDDGSFLWRIEIITKIFDGFIRLARKDNSWSNHFRYFMDEIYEGIKRSYILTLTNCERLSLYAQLSPEAFLDYLSDLFENDKDNLLKVLSSKQESFIYSYTWSTYYCFALKECLLNKDTVTRAFDLALDIYDACQTKELKDLIEDTLSPIASLIGKVAIPYKAKIERFYFKIQGKDPESYREIVKNMANSLHGSYLDSYSKNDYEIGEENKQTITNIDIYETQGMALNWLCQNSAETNYAEPLEVFMQHMHDDQNFKYDSEYKKIIEFANSVDSDDKKVVLSSKIKKEIEHIQRFDSWKRLKPHLTDLRKLLEVLTPVGLFERYSDVLFSDHFPIIDIQNIKYDDYKELDRIRYERKKDVVLKISSEIGEDNLLEKIIEENNGRSYMVWNAIYDTSSNRDRDVDVFIKKECDAGLSSYLRKFDINKIKEICKKYKNRDFVIKNLPHTREVFELIDGIENENAYWKNLNAYSIDSKDIDLVFDKMLEYVPYHLLRYYAYILEIDYERGIKLLNTVKQRLDHQDYPKNDEIEALQRLVKSLDGRFYTDELSSCEFALLHILYTTGEDYPLGIKKHFWEKPEELGNLLKYVTENLNSLDRNSLGMKLYLEAICKIGDSCYIPVDYISTRGESLSKWANDMINVTVQGSSVRRVVKSAIINTLAYCPEVPNEP